MSARAIAIHGYEMSGERRANLEIKSECPALCYRYLSSVETFSTRDTFIANISKFLKAAHLGVKEIRRMRFFIKLYSKL